VDIDLEIQNSNATRRGGPGPSAPVGSELSADPRPSFRIDCRSEPLTCRALIPVRRKKERASRRANTSIVDAGAARRHH
jgi:hypothetical protein